eukprot:CAMPEP_0174831938 /NCGR_PEP_ID=MMETSP1114-20130205/3391_1 /TAXON_ID=312471 /ORGANISM="Neobodo designis, Strain CCAP 1951/1" /LENGTH=488 /DNA_ID=CAMNT_0016065785 /DNA_START=248 /DNA_END=1710 /DNA_ORIENTATION=+
MEDSPRYAPTALEPAPASPYMVPPPFQSEAARASGAAADSEGATPYRRLAPPSLPGCLRVPLQYLFYDMLTEDDGFVDTIRKGGACLGLVIGVILPFATAGMYQEAGESTAMNVYAAAALSSSIGWIVAYLVIRNAGHVASPPTVLAAAMAFNTLGVACTVPCTLDYPFPIVLVQELVVVAVFNLAARKLWIIGFAIPYFWSAFYTAARPSPTTFDFSGVWLLDGAVPSSLSLPTRLAPFVALYIFTCVTAVVIWSMHDEYASRIDQSRASACLAAKVAGMLVGYDTEHARDLLAAAAGAFAIEDDAEDDQVALARPASVNSAAGDAPDANPFLNPDFAAVRGADSELIASLETIVSNLEAYRPHLPNWMVDAAIREAGLALDDSGLITPTSNSRRTGTGSLHRVSSGSSRHESASSRGSSAWSGAMTGSPADIGRVPGHAPGERTRSVTVARARVAFRIDRIAGSDGAAARAASAFVDIVHAAARHT